MSIRDNLPTRTGLLTLTQIIELTGVSGPRVTELVELGWLAPKTPHGGGREFLFIERDVYRIKKLERIRCDFELTDVGASIIVDLLERIEDLERQVGALKRLL